MRTTTLGPDQRRQARARLASGTLDVLVVGGGVTGAGVALDAAARGLRVGLVEQRDFASGTSSRSSKLIHGGLRYLERLEFGLVREALAERRLLLERLCPHLVQPVSFLYPLRHRGWERAYIGAGVALYDAMGGAGPLPRHRHLSRRSAVRLAPALRDDALVGAIRYWDAQVDDARHTLTVARTAARHGATLLSSAQAVELLWEGERVAGAVVRDLEEGDQLQVRADTVINATGVWTDEIQARAGRHPVRVRASKGVHLVVPRNRFAADVGLLLRTPRSVLFVIPWPSPPRHRHWIIGTTDTDWELDKAHPAASRTDIDYLLTHVNAVLREPLTDADIEGVYAGLRPLLAGGSEDTSKLSREHAVTRPVPGLVTVAGGKYTTYRVMAADAVDAAARELPRPVPPSPTEQVPLVGADAFPALWNGRGQVADESGLDVDRVEHLLRRYGSAVDELLAEVAARPELGAPIPGAEHYLKIEARYAASHEAALHLDDVLTRRTRISIETFDRGVQAAEAVAPLMAEVLGWDDDGLARELDHYRARVAAERQSQQRPDDPAADAVRTGVPDVRLGATA